MYIRTHLNAQLRLAQRSKQKKQQQQQKLSTELNQFDMLRIEQKQNQKNGKLKHPV